jgi:hypothetical protein
MLVAGFAGCGNIVSLGGGLGDNELDDDSSAASTTSGNGGGAAASSTTSGPPPCGSDPNVDQDGDGATPAEGDCNDCDAYVGPNAIEVATNPGDAPVDEDCDGTIDNVAPDCDSGLALDDADPISGAKAVDLCKFASGPDDWGVVEAKYTLPDGSAPPMVPDFDLGHGILSQFGQVLVPQGGARMLGLSSGTARQPTDPGYQGVMGFSKGYSCDNPQGFPKESPVCPGVLTGAPHDGVALEVTVRAPANAVGFSFDFNFFTTEWPAWICTSFNDVFAALLSPFPQGQTDGNITFDNQGNVVTVNNVFVEACACAGGPPCNAGGKMFTCPVGAASLFGTGFEGDGTTTNASTSWLTTSAPVEPNGEITIRWTVHDSGDSILDTTTLVDNWHWVAGGNPPPPVVTIRKPQP